MLSFCLRKAENSLAGGAFAIDVGFSIAEFIALELEKSAEFFVFTSSCIDVS